MVGFQTVKLPRREFEFCVVRIELLGALRRQPRDADVEDLGDLQEFLGGNSSIPSLDLRYGWPVQPEPLGELPLGQTGEFPGVSDPPCDFSAFVPIHALGAFVASSRTRSAISLIVSFRFPSGVR